MIKKMWQRLLGSLLAIILIVPFCFVTAKADNGSDFVEKATMNNVTAVASFNSEKVDVSWSTVQVYKTTMTINLNCIANGVLRIYFGNLDRYSHFLSYNCYITDYASNSYLEVSFMNQELLEVEFYTLNPFVFSMISFMSASKIADGTNSQLKTITDTYLSSMKTSLSALRTQVDNIAGYVDGLEGYVDGIEGKLDLAYTRLGEINSTLSVVSDYVNNIDAQLGDISLEMEYFETQLRNIKSDLDTQVNQLQTMTLVLGDIIDAITGLNTTVQGIDSLIDTISWQNSNFEFLGYTTNNGSSYSTTQGRVTNGTYTFTLRATGMNGCMLKLSLNVYPYSFNLDDVVIKTAGGIDLKKHLSYYQYSRLGIYLYFDINHITNNFWSDQTIQITIPDSYFYTTTVTTQNRIQYLTSNDIEYWQLLAYFNEYNYQTEQIASNELIADKLDDILEAIGNVSITSEQIDNSTTTFDNSVNQFQSIENIYNQQFNEVKNNVNNFDFSVSNGLSSGALEVSDLFSSFYNIEFFRVPILIVLACAIFLIVLG